MRSRSRFRSLTLPEFPPDFACAHSFTRAISSCSTAARWRPQRRNVRASGRRCDYTARCDRTTRIRKCALQWAERSGTHRKRTEFVVLSLLEICKPYTYKLFSLDYSFVCFYSNCRCDQNCPPLSATCALLRISGANRDAINYNTVRIYCTCTYSTRILVYCSLVQVTFSGYYAQRIAILKAFKVIETSMPLPPRMRWRHASRRSLARRCERARRAFGSAREQTACRPIATAEYTTRSTLTSRCTRTGRPLCATTEPTHSASTTCAIASRTDSNRRGANQMTS